MEYTPRRLFASPAVRRFVANTARNMVRTGAKRTAAYARRTYAKRRRIVGRGRTSRQARPAYAKPARMYGEASGRSKKQISSTLENIVGSVAPNGLNLAQVINISEGANINQREGNTVFLRGLRFCGEIRNTNPFPMYYNMAIVSLKHQLKYEQNATDFSYPNFFRAEGTVERSIDFKDNLDSIVYHCRALNTDTFNVFAHQRFLLPGADKADMTDADNPWGDHTYKNYKFLKRYVRIKRTIRWINQDNADLLLNPIYFIQWASIYASNSVPGVDQTDPVDSKFEVITFYNQEQRS